MCHTVITNVVAERHVILVWCRTRGRGGPSTFQISWLVDRTEKLRSVGRHIMLSNASVLQFSELRFEMMHVAFRRPMARTSLRSIFTGDAPIRTLGTGTSDNESSSFQRRRVNIRANWTEAVTLHLLCPTDIASLERLAERESQKG